MAADADWRPPAASGGTLRHSGFFAYRVPALPMSVLTDFSDLRDVAARDDVRRALAIASPDLLAAMDERGDDPGVEAAVFRYVARMASRPTPYGTFAACGVGVIGERTRLELPDPASWCAHTQLDADYLDALVREASSRLRERLTLRANDSLHLMGGRWRYVESHLDGLERSYRLLQVADSKHLQRALEAARDTAPFHGVVGAVAAGGVAPDRAAVYVHQLVDAQLLVPTLAITLTGPLPLDSLFADLQVVGDDLTLGVLGPVRDALSAAEIDHDGIVARLATLNAPIDRSRLFHVTLTVPPCDASLARSTVEDIARAVDLLRRLAPRPKPSELDAFRDAFAERYNQQEVPLLEALDEELGVGFGFQQEDSVPLLDGLRFPARSARSEASFGRREARLLELLHGAWSTGSREVQLTAADIDALADDDGPPLPAAVGATAVLARTVDGPRILVVSATGPSGARLLGRFCHADPTLERHVRAHLEAEEALDPEAVYAEVVHLPTGRLVNVLARPVLREYELEWLGRSGAPRERVIAASDLLVALRDGRFVLRSRTLGRRVVPRLTSAHNYNRHSPGVYRFLAAVQADGVRETVAWSWAPYDAAPFTPRVRRGPLVLALARWRADGEELRALDSRAAVAAWQERRSLPRWICLVEGDNVLPFDLHNPVAVDAFLRTVRRRDQVDLEELFPGPDELVASAPDGLRALEVVVPLVAQAPLARPATVVASVTAGRTFSPGSEWSYLKLYTGTATGDRLLTQEIAPCIRRLMAAGAADQWFFLRYEDPGFHLRVRAHGDPDRIRAGFEDVAARAIEQGLAWEAQFATYGREVERYGGPERIVAAERLFDADSRAVVELLDLLEPGSVGLDARWRLGLLGADRLLGDLGFDEREKAELARAMRRAFEREFRADGALRKDIGARFRAERAALDELLDAAADGDHPLAPGIAVLDERSSAIVPLVPDLDRTAAPSFVHLWLNRLCRSDARRQEYVVYSLLEKLYEARGARRRS